jgi:hypothetical protein
MTMENFDRARYGTMSVADLAAAFEQLVGEPPEKKNKLWMLKRMEQSHSSRQAVERAAARARAGGSDGGAPQPSTASEAEAEPSAVGDESGSAAAPPADQTPVPPSAPPAEPSPSAPVATLSPLAAEAPAPANEVVPEAAVMTTVAPAAAAAAEQEAGGAAAPGRVEGTVRRKYVPARFKGKSIEELHAMYLQAVGKPTKSVDVPYIAWKIGLKERAGATDAAAPRRARRVGAGRGEAKAVTLREYPDTLAAVEGVCARHQFRNRLDFFRRAAQHFLEHLGERAAAAYFAEMAPSDAAAATAPS